MLQPYAENCSAQDISWVKSNTKLLNCINIDKLYYPENIQELIQIICTLRNKGEAFDIIGYSSNTLFLPSYHIQNMICTKKLNKWYETEDLIICECGVNVSSLSKRLIKKGYIGFEGLNDLPGTIAAAVYGNSGCRHCSVNELLHSFTLLTSDGTIQELNINELAPSFRSSALKRKEIRGVIIEVRLHKRKGDVATLKSIAEHNHQIRKEQQPSGYNNLGTTFIGWQLTRKGRYFQKLEEYIQKIIRTKDTRKSFPLTLRLIGKGKYAAYTYNSHRYMFRDEKSHDLFPQYFDFLKTLYWDLKTEIEIRK